MLLPTTDSATWLALALAAFLWGSWAHTQQADRSWRFELYALDFGLGAVIVAALLAVTLGNSGSSNSFTFEDNLTVGSKRNMIAAFGGGALYGIGQMMIFSAVSLAGMSSAIPVASSVALIVLVIVRQFAGIPPQPVYVYAAGAVALVALVLAALAQKSCSAAAPVSRGMHPAWKGYILACIGGLFCSIASFAVEATRGGDIGLGSYGSTLFMALGVLVIMPLAAVFFINLPVQGEVISFKQYFRGKRQQHFLGFLGGAIWLAGTLAFYSASGAAYEGAPNPIRSQAVALGGSAIFALLGLLLWSEQAASARSRGFSAGAAFVLAAAAGLVYAGG